MSIPKRLVSNDELFRDWIEKAEVWQRDSDLSLTTWLRQSPIMIIGLGNAGKSILDYTVNYLQGRCGTNWPTIAKHIRLLHIGVSEEMEHDYRGIQYNDGYPSLTLVLDRDHRRRLSWHSGLKWFDRQRLARPNRALGRLAVFSSLSEGKEASLLWKAIQSCVGSYKNISTYIVGDAFSIETSGMIADIAHLVRVGNPPGQITRVSLFLALQNADWDDDLRQGQRNEFTYATIRELQRLQRKHYVEWHYAPGLGQKELKSTDKGPLFDEIYLFDGFGEEDNDLSDLSASLGLLPGIAECVIALLNKNISQRFYEIGANQAAEPVRSGDVKFEDVVGSMGCYVLRLPVDEFRRILDVHLLHKFLFDYSTGVIPFNQIDEQGNSRQKRSQISQIRSGDIEEFLNLRGIDSNKASSLSDKDVIWHLTQYLEYRLNKWPQGQLKWAIHFIEALESEYSSWQTSLSRVRNAIKEWVDIVTEDKQEVSSPVSMLSSVLGVQFEQQSAIITGVNVGPLYRVWEDAWDSCRKNLKKYNRIHTHHSFWNIENEPELFKQLVLNEKLWERMRSRVWWRFSSTSGTLALVLILLPNDLNQPDPEYQYQTLRDTLLKAPLAHALTAENVDEILSRVLELAHVLTQKFVTQHNIHTFIRKETKQYSQELVRKSFPLCKRRQLAIDNKVWPIPIEPHFYYSGPDEPSVNEIASLIRKSQMGEEKDSHRFIHVQSDDSTECRLLHVKHILPMQGTDAYARARSAYTHNPDLHVFEHEQIATTWEKLGTTNVSSHVFERRLDDGGKGISFSPHFVEVLFESQDGVRLFGAGLVYNIIHFDRSSFLITGVEVNFEALEDMVGKHVYNAIEHFLDEIMHNQEFEAQFRELIGERRPADYGQRILLFDNLRDTTIYPLSEQKHPVAQDIALLMGTILAEEEQTGI